MCSCVCSICWCVFACVCVSGPSARARKTDEWRRSYLIAVLASIADERERRQRRAAITYTGAAEFVKPKEYTAATPPPPPPPPPPSPPVTPSIQFDIKWCYSGAVLARNKSPGAQSLRQIRCGAERTERGASSVRDELASSRGVSGRPPINPAAQCELD